MEQESSSDLRKTAEKMKTRLVEASGSVRNKVERSRSAVRKRPLAAIGAALATGVAVGVVTGSVATAMRKSRKASENHNREA